MVSSKQFVHATILLLLLLQAAPLGAAEVELPEPAPIPQGLQTIEFFSPSVGREMKFDIVLPQGYDSSEERYPVLYLLHGYMQNYTVWGRNLGAAFYARNVEDLILVLPDGGNSWFVNYARSDDGQLNNWEDYIIRDLIPYVDANFRTEARREGRAISGLSMGGFGAFALGLRHPHLFESIGSTSGALAFARTNAVGLAAGIPVTQGNVPRSAEDQLRFEEVDGFIAEVIDIPGFSTQAERTPAGAPFETAAQAEAYDPFEIIYNVPKSQLPHIYIDSGTEDGLITVARELAQLLMLNNVPFDYMQSRGSHNSEYWRRSIGHMLNIQYEVMQRALGNRP
ncbi:MAG: alpha/beta hydrolase-fold protein [Proteobacteria bacterium]|nr:alpha/beta hydrolase-fold protein [Pseudomonadota bacterium]